MDKLLVGIICLILLGCEGDKPRTDLTYLADGVKIQSVYHDGHLYNVTTSSDGWGGHVASSVHSPQCPCQKGNK